MFVCSTCLVPLRWDRAAFFPCLAAGCADSHRGRWLVSLHAGPRPGAPAVLVVTCGCGKSAQLCCDAANTPRN